MDLEDLLGRLASAGIPKFAPEPITLASDSPLGVVDILSGG